MPERGLLRSGRTVAYAPAVKNTTRRSAAGLMGTRHEASQDEISYDAKVVGTPWINSRDLAIDDPRFIRKRRMCVVEARSDADAHENRLRNRTKDFAGVLPPLALRALRAWGSSSSA